MQTSLVIIGHMLLRRTGNRAWNCTGTNSFQNTNNHSPIHIYPIFYSWSIKTLFIIAENTINPVYILSVANVWQNLALITFECNAKRFAIVILVFIFSLSLFLFRSCFNCSCRYVWQVLDILHLTHWQIVVSRFWNFV